MPVGVERAGGVREELAGEHDAARARVRVGQRVSQAPELAVAGVHAGRGDRDLRLAESHQTRLVDRLDRVMQRCGQPRPGGRSDQLLGAQRKPRVGGGTVPVGEQAI